MLRKSQDFMKPSGGSFHFVIFFTESFGVMTDTFGKRKGAKMLTSLFGSKGSEKVLIFLIAAGKGMQVRSRNSLIWIYPRYKISWISLNLEGSYPAQPGDGPGCTCSTQDIRSYKN
jgi:hypothetical protein